MRWSFFDQKEKNQWFKSMLHLLVHTLELASYLYKLNSLQVNKSSEILLWLSLFGSDQVGFKMKSHAEVMGLIERTWTSAMLSYCVLMVILFIICSIIYWQDIENIQKYIYIHSNLPQHVPKLVPEKMF